MAKSPTSKITNHTMFLLNMLYGLKKLGLKSEETLEFSARSRFTNRKFPFVCYGSLGHIFIHVHFSSLWICEKVKWCLTSNFRCIFFIVVVIKMVCSTTGCIILKWMKLNGSGISPCMTWIWFLLYGLDMKCEEMPK